MGVLEDAYDCYRVRLRATPLEAAQEVLSMLSGVEAEPVVCLEPGVLNMKVVYHLWTHLWKESDVAACAELLDDHIIETPDAVLSWQDVSRQTCFPGSRFTLSGAKAVLRKMI